jgi:alpha-L-fucosidase
MSSGDHPWEESRGMGFSYGYNRAERLGHYKSGRELLIVLADIVSRGGNLLLDIGPDADGTIPVIMEERLAEMGAWLGVNGEGIYGTRPFVVSKQWGAGAVPKVEYDKEYDAAYDVTQLVDHPRPGQAAIEAFFTAKGKDVYAILPRWPGRRFVVKHAGALAVKTVSLLGGSSALQFARSGSEIAVELGEPPAALLGQPLFVLKLAP